MADTQHETLRFVGPTLRENERRDLIASLQNLTDEALLRDPRWSDSWSVDP